MNFYLKILGEPKFRQVLKVNGYSGLLYHFAWDELARAYCYRPKTQEEVDDIFRTMGRTTGYYFAPVSIPGAAHPAPQVAAVETPRQPLSAETTEHCIARGLIVSEDDTEEDAKRLIEAYDRGVNSALLARPKPRKGAPAPA